MRCAVVIGVDRGRLGGDFCRCAVGIGGGRVVSDSPGRCDLSGVCLCGVCLASLCLGDWWAEGGV